MRIRASELCGSQTRVQPPGKLVEEIEAGGRVLDLDRIEAELRGQPTDAVHRTAPRPSLRAPERMHRHRQTTLIVDRMHGRRRGHARTDAALEE